MASVCSFEEMTAAQQRSAGGKGGTLSRLYHAGYPVPPGFVMLPTAFDGDQVGPEAWAQVQVYLDRMRSDGADTAFAVRSSALSEDSAQASFAGEFETVLDVRTDEALREAVDAVRRSRRSERVRTYSEVQGVDSAHDIAVVQRMVRADISGVLFTADPVTGSRVIMTGNFVRGLGDQLVSGAATEQAFTIERPGGEVEGPAELKRFGRELFKLARRLEQELGGPQDIEWAIAGGKLFLLQSRPVTTLIDYKPATGDWNASRSGDYVWSNVNFGEAVSDVMTPLAWTVLRYILGEWVFLPGYPTVGNIGGRPYLNISVFATVFRALGKSEQDLLENIQGALYMRLPEGFCIPVIPLSRGERLAAIKRMLSIQLKQRRAVRDLPRYLTDNPGWCRGMRKQVQDETTTAGLLALWRKEINLHVMRSVWIVLGSAFHSADYTTPVRGELVELVGPEDADALLSNLGATSGSSDGLLASLGPVAGITQVARGEMAREAYLDLYGHRGPHEFELSVPRPAEDPDWLDRKLAQFHQSPVDVGALLAQRRADFDAAWERFGARYPRKANSMRRRLDEVARRARMREDARSEYVRDRWLVRTFALRAGELTSLGDDVFFLTLDELLDLLSGDETATSNIAARQETYEAHGVLPQYPSVIRGRFAPFQWAADVNRRSDIYAPETVGPSNVGSADLILGCPGSAGRVEGRVRRLGSPEHGDQLQHGEILVTMQTDIEWTLLFPRAGAIVTDVGAPLSHAAIVARELGIPAVVGCGDATMRVKTGDWVRVDGGQGTVEILDSAAPETSSSS